MKKNISFVIFLMVSIIYCQNPGGVPNSDIWYKTEASTLGVTPHVFKDFSIKNRTIKLGAGSSFTPTFFNYNPSLGFDGNDFLSYYNSLEDLSTATIFMVYQPDTTSTKYALMNSDWKADTAPAGEVNLRQFTYSTQLVDKVEYSLAYPTITPYTRPNALINTLIWHDFNTKKIYNSFGVRGESEIFIGKTFTDEKGVAASLKANMPEFIVYRKALSEKEKNRVESYLALKYGITLQPKVNYINSKNEIVWHKENNTLFFNRIFGIGRDSNSSLYQKQSSSSHIVELPGKLILFAGNTLDTENLTNPSIIADYNNITMGDNGKDIILKENPIKGSNLTLSKRVWLTEGFGAFHNVFNTSLRFSVPLELQPPTTDDRLWLIIDRGTGVSLSNTDESSFTGSGIEYIQPTSYQTTTGHTATYNHIKWNKDEEINENSVSTLYDQFTFAIGPKMLVLAEILPMNCSDTQGNILLKIRGGVAPFTIVTTDASSNYTNTLNNINSRDLPLNNLVNGTYTIKVTDNSGFSQTINAIVDPLLGITVDLGPDQKITNGQTIILDAGDFENVTYKWYKDGILIDGESSSTLKINDIGTYRVDIINKNNCIISDEITITNPQICMKRLHNGYVEIVIPKSVWIGDQFTLKVYYASGGLLTQKDDITPILVGDKYYIKASAPYSTKYYWDGTLTYEISGGANAPVSNTLAALPQSEWTVAGTSESCVSKANVCMKRLHNGYVEIVIPKDEWIGDEFTFKVYYANGGLLTQKDDITPILVGDKYYIKASAPYSTKYYWDGTLTYEISGGANAPVSNTLAALPQSEWTVAGTSESCVSKANVCMKRLHNGYVEIVIPKDEWIGDEFTFKVYYANGGLLTQKDDITPILVGDKYYIKASAPYSTKYYWDGTLTYEISGGANAPVSNTLAVLPQSEWTVAGTSESCVSKANVCMNRNNKNVTIFIPVNEWLGDIVRLKSYYFTGALLSDVTFSNLTTEFINGVNTYKIQGILPYYSGNILTIEVSSNDDPAVSHTLNPIELACRESPLPVPSSNSPIITIYPNPSEVSSHFTIAIQLDSVMDAVVEIFDLSGRLLKQETYSGSDTYQLSENIEKTGNYIVRVTTKDRVENQQILIK